MSNGQYNGMNPWNSGTWSNGNWYPYKSQSDMGMTSAEQAALQRQALTSPKSLNEYMQRERSDRLVQIDAAIRYSSQCSASFQDGLAEVLKKQE